MTLEAEFKRLRAELAQQPDAANQAVELPGALDDLARQARDLEQALAAACAERERYRALFDNSIDAILLLDGAWEVVEANRAACALLDFARDDLLGKSIGDFVPAGWCDYGREGARRMVSDGEYRAEFALTRRDGRVVPVEGRAMANVLPGVYMAAMRDMTLRQQAEERLKAQADLAQSLAEVATTLQSVLDRIAVHVTAVLGDACVINLLSDDRRWLLASAWHHRDPETHRAVDELLRGSRKPMGSGPSGRAAETGETVFIPVVVPAELRDEVIPERRRYLDRHTIYSLMAVPLRVKGDVKGVLTVMRERPGQPYTEADQVFLEELAGLAGMAMTNAMLFETAQIELAARRRAEAERGHLLKEVRAANDQLTTLSQRLLQVQEAERRAIARELHDEIAQSLTALVLNLQGLERGPEPELGARLLADSLEVVQAALQKVRQLSLELRPLMLDDLGLAAALRWYLDRQGRRAGLDAHLDYALPAGLPPDVATTCFRVVQEAVNNVVRHARARHAWVELRMAGAELDLAVRDDGVGFHVAEVQAGSVHGRSLGLLSMRERVALAGGRLEITSAPGQGTAVRARLPLAAETQGAGKDELNGESAAG